MSSPLTSLSSLEDERPVSRPQVLYDAEDVKAAQVRNFAISQVTVSGYGLTPNAEFSCCAIFALYQEQTNHQTICSAMAHSG
jgi:hypothetical protein